MIRAIQSCLILLLVALIVPPVSAQNILWCKADAPFPFTVSGSRKLSGAILAGSDWEYWQLEDNKIPIRVSPRFDTTIFDFSGGIDTLLNPDLPIIAAIAKDGEEIICACFDGNIVSWEPLNGSLQFIANYPQIRAISTTADGSLVAVSLPDSTVRLINCSLHRETAFWKNASVDVISLSPDGKLLLMGSRTENLKLIDVASHKILHSYIEVHNPDLVRFNPSKPGNFIVDFNWNVGGLTEMDTTGKMIAQWSDAQYGEFSPSGNRLLLSGFFSGSTSEIVDLDTHHSEIVQSTGTFINDDTLIQWASEGGISFYSISQRKTCGVLSCLNSDKGISYSKDGNSLVCGGSVWDSRTGAIVSGTYTYGEIGEHAIVGSDRGKLLVWSGGGPDSSVIEYPSAMPKGSFCIAVSPNDSLFAVSYRLPPDSITGVDYVREDTSQRITLWNLATQKLIRTFDSPPYSALALRFSHDGSLLAATMATGKSYVWKTNDGGQVAAFERGSNNSLFFLPGDSVLILPAAGMISSCDIRTGHVSDLWNNDIKSNVFASMSDGLHCAGVTNFRLPNWSSTDRGVEVIDVQTGNVLSRIATPASDSATLTCVAVNPVSGDIAVGGRDLIVYKFPGYSEVHRPEQQNSIDSYYTAEDGHIILLPIGARAHVSLYDIDGRMIFNSELIESSVRTPLLSNGVYFIVIRTHDGNIHTGKILLSR